MLESPEAHRFEITDPTMGAPTPERFREWLLPHVKYTVGTDPDHAWVC